MHIALIVLHFSSFCGGTIETCGSLSRWPVSDKASYGLGASGSPATSCLIVISSNRWQMRSVDYLELDSRGSIRHPWSVTTELSRKLLHDCFISRASIYGTLWAATPNWMVTSLQLARHLSSLWIRCFSDVFLGIALVYSFLLTDLQTYEWLSPHRFVGNAWIDDSKYYALAIAPLIFLVPNL